MNLREDLFSVLFSYIKCAVGRLAPFQRHLFGPS